MKARLEELDIMRALAILCVVLGHAGTPGPEYLYPFHMPVFFMVSGYFYSSRHSNTFADVTKNVKSKILRLWLPYFVWNTFYILLHNVFLDANLYTTESTLREYLRSLDVTLTNTTYPQHYLNLSETLYAILRSVFFRSPTVMGGAMWFLGTLFFISVAYIGVDWLGRKLLKKDPWILQTVLSAVLLGVGQYLGEEKITFDGFARVITCYFLFHMGFSFKKFNLSGLLKTKKHHAILGLVTLAILLIIYQINPGYCVDLWSNRFPDAIYLVIISLAGWIIAYCASYFLKFTPLKKVLTLIGNRTMSIMIFHYLFFKIIMFIVVKVYDLPDFCLAAQTHLFGERGLWWLAYSIVGLVGPILLYEIHKKAIKLVTPKAKKSLPAEK